VAYVYPGSRLVFFHTFSFYLYSGPRLYCRRCPFLPTEAAGIGFAESPKHQSTEIKRQNKNKRGNDWIAKLVLAEPDTLNHGVFDQQGRRLTPQFDHLVTTKISMPTWVGICCVLCRRVSSPRTPFWISGPGPELPNPLSTDKLETRYSHQRKVLGTMIATLPMKVLVLER
jgi:hypothetical protein